MTLYLKQHPRQDSDSKGEEHKQPRPQSATREDSPCQANTQPNAGKNENNFSEYEIARSMHIAQNQAKLDEILHGTSKK